MGCSSVGGTRAVLSIGVGLARLKHTTDSADEERGCMRCMAEPSVVPDLPEVYSMVGWDGAACQILCVGVGPGPVDEEVEVDESFAMDVIIVVDYNCSLKCGSLRDAASCQRLRVGRVGSADGVAEGVVEGAESYT